MTNEKLRSQRVETTPGVLKVFLANSDITGITCWFFAESSDLLQVQQVRRMPYHIFGWYGIAAPHFMLPAEAKICADRLTVHLPHATPCTNVVCHNHEYVYDMHGEFVQCNDERLRVFGKFLLS